MHMLILLIFCTIYIDYIHIYIYIYCIQGGSVPPPGMTLTTRPFPWMRLGCGWDDPDDPPAPRVIRKIFEKLKGWGVVLINGWLIMVDNAVYYGLIWFYYGLMWNISEILWFTMV